ncbi:MAG TPA: Rieske 2Fe-2S domain-containing protein [Stellaceae bacterium]|jgi:phenylpropionate dioxygenase-like ring-hydroxylating dioxygenase large terminal subunit|nr:Rieske 2Fe-2S domain-containing protein [Stellaceae bacterium]
MEQHAATWPKEGNARVPYRVFADSDVYRAETSRIFLGATWQYLGLAAELQAVGDYRTTFLGETPVIVTRGEDGEIHGMLNRCAHRGNLVCLKQHGHSDDGLTCVYHAWRYDLAGNLTSVAFRRGVGGKGGMPEGFQLEAHGLKKLRIGEFAGLVFGTLSPDAPPLSDYIGNMIGARIGRVMRGKPKILGTTSQILHNNWKLYIENVKDTYHASLLHSFFTTFQITRLTTAGGVAIGESGGNHASYTRGGEAGNKAGSDKLYSDIHTLREDYRLQDPRFLDAVDEIGDGITLQILSVFPNFVLQQIHNSLALRLVLPKGPHETELQWTYIGFEEDDAAMTERRLQQANLVGPAGYVSMEDGAVGGFIQRAIAGVEDECSVIEMGGIEHASQETRATEASVRGFWQAYRQTMGL